MAQDYDEKKTDVVEREEQSLKQVRAMGPPGALGVEEDLGESEPVEGLEPPGEIIDDELVVAVRPPTGTEFTCGSCFLIRDHSMLDHQEHGVPVCRECATD